MKVKLVSMAFVVALGFASASFAGSKIVCDFKGLQTNHEALQYAFAEKLISEAHQSNEHHKIAADKTKTRNRMLDRANKGDLVLEDNKVLKVEAVSIEMESDDDINMIHDSLNHRQSYYFGESKTPIGKRIDVELTKFELKSLDSNIQYQSADMGLVGKVHRDATLYHPYEIRGGYRIHGSKDETVTTMREASHLRLDFRTPRPNQDFILGVNLTSYPSTSIDGVAQATVDFLDSKTFCPGLGCLKSLRIRGNCKISKK